MNKKATYIGILSLALIVLIILIKTNLITTFDTAVYNLLTMHMNESLTGIAKAITASLFPSLSRLPMSPLRSV